MHCFSPPIGRRLAGLQHLSSSSDFTYLPCPRYVTFTHQGIAPLEQGIIPIWKFLCQMLLARTGKLKPSIFYGRCIDFWGKTSNGYKKNLLASEVSLFASNYQWSNFWCFQCDPASQGNEFLNFTDCLVKLFQKVKSLVWKEQQSTFSILPIT